MLCCLFQQTSRLRKKKNQELASCPLGEDHKFGLGPQMDSQLLAFMSVMTTREFSFSCDLQNGPINIYNQGMSPTPD